MPAKSHVLPCNAGVPGANVHSVDHILPPSINSILSYNFLVMPTNCAMRDFMCCVENGHHFVFGRLSVGYSADGHIHNDRLFAADKTVG